jgi:hypothetical protein
MGHASHCMHFNRRCSGRTFIIIERLCACNVPRLMRARHRAWLLQSRYIGVPELQTGNVQLIHAAAGELSAKGRCDPPTRPFS